jgi:transposase IS66 family protein
VHHSIGGVALSKGFVCAGCAGRTAYRLAARPRVFECTGGGQQHSVTGGTVFHRTRTPLRKWFAAAWLMAQGNDPTPDQGRKDTAQGARKGSCPSLRLRRRLRQPYTNNVSERALRPSVIFRKVANGFRSEWGAETSAAFRSLAGTANANRRAILGNLPLPQTRGRSAPMLGTSRTG